MTAAPQGDPCLAPLKGKENNRRFRDCWRRGSLEVGDVLSDLTANPLELFGLVGVEGLAHEGMMAAATYVQCNTAPALEALARELPGWPLFITGHSMGGDHSCPF